MQHDVYQTAPQKSHPSPPLRFDVWVQPAKRVCMDEPKGGASSARGEAPLMDPAAEQPEPFPGRPSHDGYHLLSGFPQ